MARTARKRVLERYTTQRMASDYQSLYERLTPARAARAFGGAQA